MLAKLFKPKQRIVEHAFDATSNESEMTSKQLNESIKEDLQVMTNDTRIENVQDYTTYIRETNRNTQDLKNAVKANIQAAASLIAKNEMNVTGCGIFKGDVSLNQTANLTLKLEQGIELLQSTSEKLKNEAKMESTTTTTVEQGASSDSSATGKTDQSSDQGQESKQESKQEGFIGRFSPLRMLEGFRGLAKIASSRRHTERFFNLTINKNKMTTEQVNKSRQISEKILNNNTAISNKINTAYDKVVEVFNEYKKEEQKSTEVSAKNEASVSNVLNLGIDPEKLAVLAEKNAEVAKGCVMVFEGKLDINQKAEVTSSVVLKGVISQMSDTSVDSETAAIMADMMGLTQTAESTSKTESTTTQNDKQGQKSTETNDQSGGGINWTMIIGAIVAIIVLIIVMKMLSNGGGAGGSSSDAISNVFERLNHKDKDNDRRTEDYENDGRSERYRRMRV